MGAGGELGDLAVQGLEPLPRGGVVHGAVLECGVVALDRVLLSGDLVLVTRLSLPPHVIIFPGKSHLYVAGSRLPARMALEFLLSD